MKKGWLIIGVMLGCTTGASLAACSSSTPGGTAGSTTGHSSSSSSSGASSSSSGTTSSSSSSSSGSTVDAGCQSDPSIHAADGGSIYCGFAADGGSLTCPTGQECCIGGATGGTFAPDQCAAWGTACQNPAGGGLAVVCEQPSDCAANGFDGGAAVCCLMGLVPAQVTGCSATDLKAKGGTGTQCLSGASCGAGNTQLCLTTNDCSGGKVCTPFRWKIIEMGFCM